MNDMYQNNRIEIRCPCRKCKLGTLHNPFSGTVRDHLLMHGFMDGHTQWISDEDDEQVHGATAGNEEGHQDNNDEGREDEEPPAHDGEEAEQHVEDADTRTPLTSVVRDPHDQELLLKKMTNARAAAVSYTHLTLPTKRI